MDATLDKVLDTIARLKNLAARPGTPAEAVAATAKIHRLMVKHNLSAYDVDRADLDRSVGFANERFDLGGNNHWREWLYGAVARYMFCKPLFDWRGRGVSIVGRPENIVVAHHLYDYLVATINRLADEGWEAVAPEMRWRSTARRWKGSFRTGAASEMATRLAALRREDVAAEQASALVVIEQEALDAAFTALYPETVEVKSRSSISDALGRMAGQQAARGISLAEQIGD